MILLPNPEIDAYLEKLPDDMQLQVNALRSVFLSIDNQIQEHIKWNSPAFHYTGELPLFDPKTYRSDLAVIHTRKKHALLVFPSGFLIQKESPLFSGKFDDGRRMIQWKGLEHIQENESELKAIIKDWLKTLLFNKLILYGKC